MARRTFLMGLGCPAIATFAAVQAQAPTRREFAVTATRFTFEPQMLEVRQDDLVKVTFRAEDIAHSFTIDAYRIAKRAGAGQAVVFEFRADRPGRFPFYCNLSIDDRCRDMRGELVVRSR
jgi:nitrous-oxide reductase